MKTGGTVQLDFRYLNIHNKFLLNLCLGERPEVVNTINLKVRVREQFTFILILWYIFM